jgi:hypothetical protein
MNVAEIALRVSAECRGVLLPGRCGRFLRFPVTDGGIRVASGPHWLNLGLEAAGRSSGRRRPSPAVAEE